jgi:hypothetical protein
VDARANEKFIDMMERYFGQADGVQDARPELSFQVKKQAGQLLLSEGGSRKRRPAYRHIDARHWFLLALKWREA